MINKNGKEDIYLIFEGLTEELFLKKMQQNFKSKYNLILVNAKGKDNIIKKYKSIKRKNNYNNVCVMYDLDNVGNIETILKLYKNNDIKIKKSDIYFINPMFEMIFILCKENKYPIDKYKFHLKRLYNVSNYEKTKTQIEKIIKSINKEEIIEMIDRLKMLMNNKDNLERLTNYNELFKKLFEI